MLGSMVRLGSRVMLLSRVMLDDIRSERAGPHLNMAMSRLTSTMLATSRKMTRRSTTSQLA